MGDQSERTRGTPRVGRDFLTNRLYWKWWDKVIQMSIWQNNYKMESVQKSLQDFCKIQSDVGRENVILEESRRGHS